MKKWLVTFTNHPEWNMEVPAERSSDIWKVLYGNYQGGFQIKPVKSKWDRKTFSTQAEAMEHIKTVRCGTVKRQGDGWVWYSPQS